VHHDPSFLQILWFVLIGVLWSGYFVLEGFDFGVGMLLRVVARDQSEKRAVIHTIGPVWDGNEVWLLVAGGATFAAFPGWYASAFSGFYLALFLVLAALIVRGVSFEFWGKVPSARWRAGWEWALAISSGAAALLFGVAWANFAHGVPMGPDHQVHASLLDLLHPYALLGGVTTLSLFAALGAGFLTLRTTGAIEARARLWHWSLVRVAALSLTAFAVWTASQHSSTSIAAVSLPLLEHRSSAFGFAGSTLATVLLVAVLLVSLFPNALPSSTASAFDLTLVQASSSHYTLTVMTVVAAIFVPIVLAYQSWTYWVFRHRLGRDDYDGALTPVAVLEHRHRQTADQPTTPPDPNPPAGVA